MESRHVSGRMPRAHALTVSSLKQLILWGDHLKVDQQEIDTQHEVIFNIATEVADAWHRRGDIDRLKALAEKLAKVLESHFRYEELQLAAIGYPKLEEHKVEHAVMLDELQVIRTRLDHMGCGSNTIASAFIVYNFVLGLTVGHICHSDMDYGAFARDAAEDDEQGWPAS